MEKSSWLKLKMDFFSYKGIKYLLSLPNGYDYVILYLGICLMATKNDGKVEYNVEEIVKTTKHFKKELIVQAIEVFKSIGLIYLTKDNVIIINDYKTMSSN